MRLPHFLKTLFFFLLISTSSYLAATPNTVTATIDVGKGPYSITITPNGQAAYVPNSNDNTVSVIDTASNTVIATVNVGLDPNYIAITPNGLAAYVSNASDTTVSVIDSDPLSLHYNMVIATVVVGNSPLGIAITPDGKAVYVPNSGMGSNTVSVIDTESNVVIATVAVDSSPQFVAITPDGLTAYISNSGSSDVSVIDSDPMSPNYNTVIAIVAVGSSPMAILSTPDGSAVYVFNSGTNTVSVIDTASNVVFATITVGSDPQFSAITPNGKKIFVPNYNSSNVSIIDSDPLSVNYNTVIATVAAGIAPDNIAITPNGAIAYVSDDKGSTISVIDTASNSLITTIMVGMSSYIAITPNGQVGYSPNFVSNNVSVIDTALFVLCPNNNILFVNNSCTSDGDGSYAMPFNNLTEALFQNCDVIYVFPGNGPYDANNATGFVLKPNQRLLGTSTQAFQFCSDCAKPTLENTGGGPVVALSSNNEVSGFIINPSTNLNGVQGIDIANALVTNNVITTTGSGECILFNLCPLIGDVTISNCQFFASDSNQTSHGIFIQQCGNGNFTVQNNNFGALNNPTGFEHGFVMQILTGACTLALNNNIFSIQNSNSGTSDVLLDPSSVFPLTARLFRNTLQLFSSGTPAGGIVTTVSASGTAYLSLVENSVSTPSNIPGYSLINNSFEGAFQCFDLFNLGSIDTSTTMFPITYVPTEG